MNKRFWAIVAAFGLSGPALAQTAAPAQPSAAVKLVRLDCGGVIVNDLDRFSDTRAYVGQTKQLAASCYLIKHGNQYLLWDAGLPAALKGAPVDAKAPMAPTLRVTLVEQLAQLGIKPEQVTMLGVSHYHFDHIGQAAAFPQATLLIGKDDYAALKAGTPGTSTEPLAPWFSGGSKTEQVAGDKDVFGDGSVTMLDLPGHTPGHHGLLVKLAGRGNVLLTGDVAHFRENYDSDGIPGFNTNRADSLAALSRFKGLAKNLKATVVIQHDARDIAKLPAFPTWAE